MSKELCLLSRTIDVYHTNITKKRHISNFTLHNIWIEEAELNKFENQLDTEKISELTDMSGFTIIRLQHIDDFTKIEINPIKARMSNEYDRLNITMFVEYNLISHLYHAFNDYAKWW